MGHGRARGFRNRILVSVYRVLMFQIMTWAITMNADILEERFSHRFLCDYSQQM